MPPASGALSAAAAATASVASRLAAGGRHDAGWAHTPHIKACVLLFALVVVTPCHSASDARPTVVNQPNTSADDAAGSAKSATASQLHGLAAPPPRQPRQVTSRPAAAPVDKYAYSSAGTRVNMFDWLAGYGPRDPAGVPPGLTLDEEAVALHGTRCNIDRRPDLTREEFDRVYRGKRPVVMGGLANESLHLTVADLANYIHRVGAVPFPLFHPTGRPGVGGHLTTLAEYLASFRLLSERDPAYVKQQVEAALKRAANSTVEERASELGVGDANARRRTGSSCSDDGDDVHDADGMAAAAGLSSFHCSAQALSSHPELVDLLMSTRYRGRTDAFGRLLNAQAKYSTATLAPAAADDPDFIEGRRQLLGAVRTPRSQRLYDHGTGGRSGGSGVDISWLSSRNVTLVKPAQIGESVTGTAVAGDPGMDASIDAVTGMANPPLSSAADELLSRADRFVLQAAGVEADDVAAVSLRQVATAARLGVPYRPPGADPEAPPPGFDPEDPLAAGRPSIVHPAVCRTYGYTDPYRCPCTVHLFILGESGAGVPWHWHQAVIANEVLWGHKRFFLSKGSPPGGYNHRRTQMDWMKHVYPTLPDSVFEVIPPADAPEMYECTLNPGEALYVPHAFWHGTLCMRRTLPIASASARCSCLLFVFGLVLLVCWWLRLHVRSEQVSVHAVHSPSSDGTTLPSMRPTCRVAAATLDVGHVINVGYDRCDHIKNGPEMYTAYANMDEREVLEPWEWLPPPAPRPWWWLGHANLNASAPPRDADPRVDSAPVVWAESGEAERSHVQHNDTVRELLLEPRFSSDGASKAAM